MGRIARTSKHPGLRPDDDPGELYPIRTRGERDDTDFDDCCDDPDTGIGNVSVSFDGEPGDLAIEMRAIFKAYHISEIDE